jgi:hypothetical protein
MTPNHHNPRNAKRKADSPEAETSILSSSRPQRKKQKHTSKDELSSSPPPPASPVTNKAPSQSALKDHLLALYNEIQNAVDDRCLTQKVTKGADACSDRSIASDFMKLPPKKRYPDYYVIIKKPIALDIILERIENDEYDDTDALKADITLMTSNAKKYNVKESTIYTDAAKIQVRSF